MKTKITLLVTILVAFLTFNLKAQEKQSGTLENFQISIESTKNRIKLQSEEGSAWLSLSFNIDDYQPWAVNQFGMTKTDSSSSKKESKLADYLFTISKNKDKIVLKGVKGTAWKDLSFSLRKNQKVVINQFGMKNQNGIK